MTPRFWSLLVGAVRPLYVNFVCDGLSSKSGGCKRRSRHVRAQIEAIEARNEALREELAYLKAMSILKRWPGKS